MAKQERGQTTIYKTLNRKLKTEQHDTHPILTSTHGRGITDQFLITVQVSFLIKSEKLVNMKVNIPSYGL